MFVDSAQARRSEAIFCMEAVLAWNFGLTIRSKPLGKRLRFKRKASRAMRFKRLRWGALPNFLVTVMPKRIRLEWLGLTSK